MQQPLKRAVWSSRAGPGDQPEGSSALQTFPDDYEFFGAKNRIARWIGNAVPVSFAEAYGEGGHDGRWLTVAESLRLAELERT